MNAQQLDIAIDYLTITSTHQEDIAGFVEAFLKAIPSQTTGRPFKWMNYVGESYVTDDGHLSWGVKTGHGLAQMSGKWSDRVFRNLEQFRLLDFKCTRIDLAVTVCLPVAQQLVKQALLKHAPGKGNYSAITKTNGEGGTLYVGCRASDQFGRLYDKGAEIRSRLNNSSVPNAVLWRYEVEYKRSMAKAIRDSLARAADRHDALDTAIKSNVYAWFSSRAIVPVFTMTTDRSSVVQVATRVTSADKTLDWFRTQVRPAIQRVGDEAGTAAILEALGVEIEGNAWLRLDRSKFTPVQRSLWEIDFEPL